MELTSALVKAGAQRGFRTILLDDMPRSVTDPDDIDYDKLQTDADMILHVQVTTSAWRPSSTRSPRRSTRVR